MYETLKKKKLFLLDMDGTIYLGNNLFDGTLDFLQYVKKSGGRYLFLTNNSSRGVETYVEKLAKMGIPATEDDFLTSVHATAVYLEKKRYRKIYALGTRSFRAQLQDFPLTTTPDEDVDCLLMGFDTELTFQKLEDASRILVRDGVDYIATNPDFVCPTAFGSVPDCGSVSQMLKNATGRLPYFIGKPQPDMVQLALAKTGFLPEDAVMIGDRLYTDIACGYNAGIDTLFVLSGEGTMEDVEKSEEKPTFILQNIRALHRLLTAEN